MKWWIKKNGRPEGPFSESDIRKRIALNMLGSLDRVSSDGSRWAYLKDTALWRPPTPQTPPSPFSVAAESDLPAVMPKISDRQPPSVPIPERLRLPQEEVRQKTHKSMFVWGVCGGLAATIAVLLGAVWLMSMSRNHGAKNNAEKVIMHSNDHSSKRDGFEAVKDKLALIKCKEGSGTGFLLGMDGKTYLVSNEHVVRSVSEIEARLLDGTLLRLGEFSVAADGRDLARFEVLNCTNMPLVLRASMPNMNEQVTVYGNSLGGGVATESKGFIQGVGPKRIETNAEIVHGNSGSPLVDTNGEVIGVAAFMELTDSGQEDWGNTNTRYDGKVRRFAVRPTEVTWKMLQRNEYEAQIRAFTEFEKYWEYLVPFLLFDTRKIDDSKLRYNDLCGKDFRQTEAGFDEVMKAVANAYERRGKALVRWSERAKGRKDFVRHLNSEIESNAMSEDVAKKALAEYDDKTVNAYEKMKEAVRRMILVRKEALSHAQTFLRGHTWDSPQVMNGYDDDPSGSVTQYRSWLGGAMDLMNQKLKDLNKDIKEIEQGDDDDEDN